MGRVNLLNIDCPFKAAEAEIEKYKDIADIILVDFHAETTSEKIAMGYFLDGKVSAVFGTHTHIQTLVCNTLGLVSFIIALIG